MYNIIGKDIMIEELVEKYPSSITFLMDYGIRCLRCGEPVWGTLESAAKEKGFNDEQINYFVAELNKLVSAEEH